ncbi:hypothetical protein [Dictyobacter formicarum]|uniref:Polymerase beta nucleotidyltransferase domain-containing protein n=1 Tax=Dictyobacter formicarum TaxID=2778368 RepID=A0ABQ3VG69_9CHLR|nr:hypothetical protein [Dictyobacter formicarum]GHO84709.1 hypothetical protein KSZ_27150 [Dictyobacter formicarum]
MHDPGMTIARGNISTDVSHITHKVITEYSRIGDLAFGYGQGSVFAGFSRDSDLDINLVWERACPPQLSERPVALLCDSEREPVQFDEASLALDKLWVDGRQVDVVHHTGKTFNNWLEQIRHGDGWLFHDLQGKLLRDAYITWFAAEHHYCPHMKRLHSWIERFNMNAQISEMEQKIWEVPNLAPKLQLVVTMVENILQVNP